MDPADKRREQVTGIAVRGGLESGSYAFAGSLLTSLLAQSISPAYRRLTLPGKTLIVCVVTAGSALIGAEHSVYNYNRPFMAAAMRDADRDGGFLWRHRFEAAGGAVLAAVTGGMLYMAGNERRTGAEKLMSVRLFSHAIGLGTLLGLVSVAAIYKRN